MLVCGQCVLDRVHAPGETPVERLGGAPIFAAAALRHAGLTAAIATRGGTPELRAPLLAYGLSVTVGPSAHTFVSDLEIFGDGERRHTLGGLGDPFTPADVAGWMAAGLAGARTVVAGAQWRDDFPGETLAALAAGGRRVLLDGQGPARASGLGPIRLGGPLEPAWVTGVGVLKCSEEEAEVLLGGIDASAARSAGLPCVVLTHGHRGALVVTAREAVAVAGEPILGLADTVGAGDSFLTLMGAALDAGAGYVEAAQSACDGTSAILRERLESLA
jgi:sugar/nucleoside kinase (ribokinase family)